MTRPANLHTGPHPLEGVQVIRQSVDVSFLARRQGAKVILRLNRDTYVMNVSEALRMANGLVDAAEATEETLND